MHKLTRTLLATAVLAVTGLSTASAFADIKIAVLDYRAALLESNAAKAYTAQAKKKFGPQVERLKKLESDADGIRNKVARAGDKLSKAERERLELEFKQKARDFQAQSKQLNDATNASEQGMLGQLKPKLDRAVDEVSDKGGYDLVIDRNAAVKVKPQYDITRQVIERINQLR